jgi:hypothetical protein
MNNNTNNNTLYLSNIDDIEEIGNDFDVISELNLPPSGSQAEVDLYCDEVLPPYEEDNMYSFGDAISFDSVKRNIKKK